MARLGTKVIGHYSVDEECTGGVYILFDVLDF